MQRVGAEGSPPRSGAVMVGSAFRVPGSATSRASTPPHIDDQSVHASGNGGGDSSTPAQRSFSIHADGSSHRGRRYFDAVAQEAAWQQGRAEEYALEQHSLEDAPHPAALAGSCGHGVTAGQAALQLGSNFPASHQAPWHGSEDGSTRRGEQSPGLQGRGSPGTPGDDRSGRSSSKGQGFDNAVVLIEEPRERDVFSWPAYFGSLHKKLKGGLDTRLPVPPFRDIFWSWLGAFLGILAVSAMNQWVTPEIDIVFLVGSFGASAVLLFGLIESKMSQPRNFLGGQMLSALVGITVRVIIHEIWIAAPVGMSLALVAMQLTATTHPPGGATALIACTLPELPKWHGYSYLVTIAVGSCTMQLIALVVNNIDPRRRYPTFWY